MYVLVEFELESSNVFEPLSLVPFDMQELLLKDAVSGLILVKLLHSYI